MQWSSEFGTSNQYIVYQIGIEETGYSVADNTSTFRTQVFIRRTNTGFETYGSGKVYYRIRTSTGEVGQWWSCDLTWNDKITSDGIYVAEDTWGARVHDSEGNLNVAIDCYIEHEMFSSDSHEFTIAATSIPRVSQPSLSASSVNFGNNITIYTNRQSSSFTHHLHYSFNGGSEVGITSGITDSYTWTVPASLMNSIPNATSATITFRLYTFSGSTNIGSKIISFTATVPSNVVPSISSIACADPNGYASTYGAYVQSKSKVKITASASGSYSSTIKSYKITANGQNYTANGCTTDVLTSSGTNTISVTVTDSRGRTATKSTTISVLAYASPTITTLSAYRCTSDGTANEDGAYMKVTYKASITALNNKNGKAFTLQYKKQSDTSYTTHSTYNSAYSWEGYAIISASIDDGYNALLIAQDNFSIVSKQIDVSTAFTLMDFNKTGKGIAFGKVSEKDAFECKLRAIFEGVVEGVYPVGSIYMTTVNKNPSAYFGGTWVAWGSGRVPVGVNTADGNFNTVEKTGGSAALQAHTHGIPALSGSTNSTGSHRHNSAHGYNGTAAGSYAQSLSMQWYDSDPYSQNMTEWAGGHTHTVTTNASTTGSTGSGNSGNLQPYITCYMWKRTA